MVENVTIELHDRAAMLDKLPKVVGLYDGHAQASAPQVSVDARTQVLLAKPMDESDRALVAMLVGGSAGPGEIPAGGLLDGPREDAKTPSSV